jgi:ribonuclease HI
MTDIVIIYTDGSSSVKKINDIRCGGIGIFSVGGINITKGYKNKTVTNQRMELMACIEGIKATAKLSSNIHVKTDSMYTINCVTKWADQWKKNGWTRNGKPICNLDLIKKLYNLTKKHNINYYHVRAHKKEPSDKQSEEWINWNGNNKADILARSAMEKKRK